MMNICSTQTLFLAVAIPVTLGVMEVPALRAQAPSSERFEVASVRRVEIPTVNGGVPVFPTTGGVGTASPLRISYKATWLGNLIATAYGVRGDQVTGPEWLSKERYDVVANIPEGATKEQFNRMLQNLLRERFNLRFHIESKSHRVYALRVGKNGPKVKPTARRADEATDSGPGSGGVDTLGCPNVSPSFRGIVSLPKGGNWCWTGQDVPMTNLARLLEQPAGRPVVDETGLTGNYDFKLHFHWLRVPADPGVASDPALSVFAAVEDQLGLKLESTTTSFDQLIVDSIDREPTAN